MIFFLLLLFYPLGEITFVPAMVEGRVRPLEFFDEKTPLLPDQQGGNWHTLYEAKLTTENFTPYDRATFDKIKTTTGEDLKQLLVSSYQQIAGTVYREGLHTSLAYPSMRQLSLESTYLKIPWTAILLFLYFFALIGLFLQKSFGYFFLILTFLMHLSVLGLRSYILGRPPVSNMQETLLYVPCVAVFLALILRSRAVAMAASLVALSLLTLLHLFIGHDPLASLQPVLNSQFWLVVHVLLVVGSYGAYLLGGVAAHIYCLRPSKKLSQLILQTLYAGTALLIPGTLLGGIWAAESWGRFWDWDPKESWAFISSCYYLLVIHAYRFHKIEGFGLALGAIIGIQFITFTWYGVNYLLGVGLHSYGFGSGGLLYYLLFIFSELLFIGWTLINRYSRSKAL